MAVGNDYLKLWYNKPADSWKTEALPIGNGNIGGMIFGRTDRERVQFNEITLWSGGAYSNPDYTGGNKSDGGVSDLLKEIRQKLFAGDTASATKLSKGLLGGSVGWSGYQDMGSIYIDFKGDAKTIMPENYRRELDLKNSLQCVTYSNNGVEFKREYFCSNPGNVMVMHFTSSQKEKLSFELSVVLNTSRDQLGYSDGVSHDPSKEYTIKAENHTIFCQGKVVTSNMAFALQVKVIAPGASVTDHADGTIRVTGGDDVVILMSAGTNYDITEAYHIKEIADFHTKDGDYLDNNDPDGELAMERVRERIQSAEELGYEALLKRHQEDYKSLFGRVELDLGDWQYAEIPTDELQEKYKNGDKNRYLEGLMFQYGRYMLISSSRDAVLPANLQGLWNDSNAPEWACDYHFDINLQMNYWPAFVTNLAETAEPLVTLLDAMRVPGNLSARTCFGVEKGWVVNGQMNVFGMTGANSTELEWGFLPGGGAWICNNLWDYYLFTQDRGVLERIYPIMKEAAQFWDGWLVVEPNTGELVSAPSMSPEQTTDVSIGTTYDMTLAYMLFQDVIEAAGLLGVDEEFRKKLKSNLERMHPFAIGDDGQLKEWRFETSYNTDSDGNPIGEAYHRHLSHLLGVHPGNLISTDTPELLEAVKKTLAFRKNGIEEQGVVGWSVIQKANLWARIRDGEKAYAFLSQLFSGGVFQNLFNNVCNVFQIEGNLGASSAMAEMLLQSHIGYIEPLPALPSEWQNGSWRGLMARGNFETDAVWKDGHLKTFTVRSGSGRECIIRYPGIGTVSVTCEGKQVEVEYISNDVIRFATNMGMQYLIGNIQ